MKKIASILICIIIVTAPFVASAEVDSPVLFNDYFVSFEPWQGTGDAKAEVVSGIDSIPVVCDKFVCLMKDDEEVNSDNYTVEQGNDCVILTLKESYLSEFPDGTHYFCIHFRNVWLDLKLYVFREKAVATDVVFDFNKYTPGDGLPSVHITNFDKKIPIGADLIECLKLNNEIIDEKYYSASSFGGVITVLLKLEYYNTLTAGTHYFDIEFMSVSGVKLKIDIPVRDRAGDVAQMSYYWYDGGRVGEVCYIDNGYMALYHDLFFKEMYANYLTLPDKSKKISSGLYNDIKYFINDNFYLCLYLSETGADVSSIQGVAQVKYSSEKYPCAVVKVIGGNDIDSILADERVEYVGYSFSFVAPFWGDPGWSLQRNFNAADARKVLRIAARLDKIEHIENRYYLDEYIEFFAKDINMDGKLTASDARGVLRIAARLDNAKYVVYPY